MTKAIKALRQVLQLGMFWVAVCASLVGMVTYTKTGLEALVAEQLAEHDKPRASRPTVAAAAAVVHAAVAVPAPAAPAQAARGVETRLTQARAEPAPLLVQPPQRAQRQK